VDGLAYAFCNQIDDMADHRTWE